MYKRILVALDNSPADESLLPHIAELAKFHQSELLLVHVADGWVARHYAQFALKESDEMVKDRQYLEETARQLRGEGLDVHTHLALGEPAEEILKIAEARKSDLIAMTSHGHRFFADIFFGSTIEAVRHRAEIPLLVVKQKRQKASSV